MWSALPCQGANWKAALWDLKRTGQGYCTGSASPVLDSFELLTQAGPGMPYNCQGTEGCYQSSLYAEGQSLISNKEESSFQGHHPTEAEAFDQFNL